MKKLAYLYAYLNNFSYFCCIGIFETNNEYPNSP